MEMRLRFLDATFGRAKLLDTSPDKMRLRLRQLLLQSAAPNLAEVVAPNEVVQVTSDVLQRAMRSKGHEGFTLEEGNAVIKELTKIYQGFSRSSSRSSGNLKQSQASPAAVAMGSDAFLYVVFHPDLLHLVSHTMLEQVHMVVGVLLAVSAEDLVHHAVYGDTAGHSEGEQRDSARFNHSKLLMHMDYLVTSMVIASLLSMGISMDFHPNHPMWLVLETLCSTIFLTDVVFKLWILGFQDFFKGEARQSNLLDLAITTLAVLEMLIHFLSIGGILDSHLGTNYFPLSRGVAVLRAVRLVRVVRLVKLQRSPFMKTLVNMLAGFVIGLPTLWWVFFLVLAVLYVMGVIFRITLGPVAGQDLISQCGPPDEIGETADPMCKVHFLYGEEFFGTTWHAMFTTFRMMMGDASTFQGKSICVAMASGYGLRFHVPYVLLMTVSMFGLFNIITAIFVETMTQGLKTNDVNWKRASLYQGKYVVSKLSELLRVLKDILPQTSHGKEPVENMQLSRSQFDFIMNVPKCSRILRDLDLNLDLNNPACLFDTFDTSCDGYVTLSEFLHTILKLRGDPEKKDIIATSLALNVMQSKLDNLILKLTHEHHTMKTNHEMLMEFIENQAQPEKKDIIATSPNQAQPEKKDIIATSRTLR